MKLLSLIFSVILFFFCHINANDNNDKIILSDLPCELFGKISSYLVKEDLTIRKICKSINKKFFDNKIINGEDFYITFGEKGRNFKDKKNLSFFSAKNVFLIKKNESSDKIFMDQLFDFMKYYGKKTENISIDFSGVNLFHIGKSRIENISYAFKKNRGYGISALSVVTFFNIYKKYKSWRKLENEDRIKVLIFDRTKIEINSMIKLISKCKNLRYLSLDCIDLRNISIKEIDLISDSIKNIIGLSINRTKITESSFFYLVGKINNPLKSLQVKCINLNKVNDKQVDIISTLVEGANVLNLNYTYLKKKYLLKILSKINQLDELHIASINLSKLSEKEEEKISNLIKNATFVDVFGTDLKIKTLIKVFSKCRNLEKFYFVANSLSNIDKNQLDLILPFIKNCKEISFYYSGISLKNMNYLISKCPLLKFLNRDEGLLAKCDEVNLQKYKKITENIDVLLM